MENMRKEYQVPKAEKMEFSYSETVVASGTIVCGSGYAKVYTDTGVPNCGTTFKGYEQVWKADNL